MMDCQYELWYFEPTQTNSIGIIGIIEIVKNYRKENPVIFSFDLSIVIQLSKYG